MARGREWIGFAVFAVLLTAFPLVAPESIVDIGVYALIYGIAALGLSLLMGLAGQVNLGQAAFFAIGAYTQGMLVTRYGVALPVAAVAAVAFAMLAALLVGLPLLRLRGHYLALATLGLGIIVTVAATESDYLGATSGIYGIAKPEFGGRRYDSAAEFFWLLAPVMFLAVLFARNVVAGRIGRALGAINDSEVAAECLGADTFRLRLQVFVLSAGYGGLAGVAYVHWIGVVNPNAANFPLSVEFLLMAVLGGLGSVWGAVIGAVAVEFLDEGLRDVIPRLIPHASGEVQLIGFGVALTAVVLFVPGGLYDLWRRAVTRLRRRSATPAAPSGSTVDTTDETPVLSRPDRPAPGTTLLSVEGLVRHFGGVTALDGVSFDVRAGEIFGLIGPNGAGKTTCFNIVSGVLAPSGGSVRLRGTRIDGRKPHVSARARATRTFQNLQIFGSTTVRGNVAVGRHLRGRAGLLRAALVLPARAEERAIARSVDEILALVGIADAADRPAADLSFGRQRLVEIARALALEPDLLLLDEPMAGLSGGERADLARLLRRLRAGGMAIVLVEHDVEAVLALADRVAVLDDGVLIALGRPDEVRHDPAVVAAYLGLDEDDEVDETADDPVVRAAVRELDGG